MHLFKASSDTYQSVILNKKHAFKGKPKGLCSGDIVLLSKNKKGLKKGEKQIQHFAYFKELQPASDEEINLLWPSNEGRWNYITEFSSVHEISSSFDLYDVLAKDNAKPYMSVMTHCQIQESDTRAILNRLAIQESPPNAPKTYLEGNLVNQLSSRYERDPKAREACLNFYGSSCQICEFDFEEAYGKKYGEGFIHVHHITPVSLLGEEHEVNPEKDLIPVCPNCHSMLHKESPPILPETLKAILHSNRK